MLGRRVVDCDHGNPQLTLGGERLETDDPGRGLLGRTDDLEVTPLGVEELGEVGAVVHGHGRPIVEHRVEMLVVGLGGLAADGVDRDALGHQGGSHVVLGGQRVGSGEERLRTAVPQGQHQVGRLRGDVETGGDDMPFQRTLLEEALADGRQDGHPAPCPLDPAGPHRGE